MDDNEPETEFVASVQSSVPLLVGQRPRLAGPSHVRHCALDEVDLHVKGDGDRPALDVNVGDKEQPGLPVVGVGGLDLHGAVTVGDDNGCCKKHKEDKEPIDHGLGGSPQELIVLLLVYDNVSTGWPRLASDSSEDLSVPAVQCTVLQPV